MGFRTWVFASRRKLLYPRDSVCSVLAIPDSQKMLARYAPGHRFQFCSAAVVEIRLSAK